MENIKFSEWQKLDLRVGKIINIEDIEGTDNLYKIEVDLGKELGKRIICAGIKKYYKKEELKNKKIILFTNLEPKIIRGIKSEGMLLAVVEEENNKVVLIIPEKDIELGSRVS
ncbi:MAG: hypothetical protein QW117_00320 [Candidatus Pacearchaeota archaeon]